MIPKYPIYIVSKGRYDTRYTAKSLEEMKCPYNIIVDATEVDEYTKATDERYGNVIIQPQKYYDDYDMFWEDTNKVTGPGAARNFAWDHSIEKGFDFHWVMDDNIQGFARLNRNKKYKVTSASIFRAMEDFVDRYENIAMAGPNYRFFASQNSKLPPFSMNTRIYSCNLIRNDTPYRWRGRYNEDTDLSFQSLYLNKINYRINGKKYINHKWGGSGSNYNELFLKNWDYLKNKWKNKILKDVR